MLKKRIQSSNLALRFYRSDGWTYDEIKDCLIKGDLIFQDDVITHRAISKKDTIIFKAGDVTDLSYWILDHSKGSKFDVDKLLSKMLKLERRFNDDPQETDREYIERFNGFE